MYKAINCATNEVILNNDATSLFFTISEEASKVGGTVYVKSGEYYNISSIKLHSNVKWVGDGYSTHLKLSDNALQEGSYPLEIKSSIFLLVSIENVAISNIRFDGNREKNPFLFGEYNHETVLIVDSTNVLLDNVQVENSRKIGISIRDSENVQVENSLITNSGTFGFVAASLNGYTTNVNIRHSTVLDSGWNHISFQRIGGGNGQIYGCEAYNNYVAGQCGDIALDTWSNNNNYLIREISFINNIVDGMSGIGSDGVEYHFGVRLEKAASCYAYGNKIVGVNRGIMDDPWGGGNHTITGNSVILKDNLNPVPIGIELYKGNNLIHNNTIYSAPKESSYGFTTGGSYNMISSNVFIQLSPIYHFVAIKTDNGDGYNVVEGNNLEDCIIVLGGTIQACTTDTIRNNNGYPN